jgi:hypothetical protein
MSDSFVLLVLLLGFVIGLAGFVYELEKHLRRHRR